MSACGGRCDMRDIRVLEIQECNYDDEHSNDRKEWRNRDNRTVV